MGIKVITPADPVLTLAEMRLHLRLDTAGGVHPDDTLVSALLSSAVQYCEHYTRRSIGTQTLELALDAFPDGPVNLPNGPLQSIVSIKYFDGEGVDQTLPPDEYIVDDYGMQQNWVIAVNAWPATGEYTNAVKIRYIAGSVEPTIKSALLLMIGHLYANRENSSSAQLKELPMGVTSLLNTAKVWGL